MASMMDAMLGMRQLMENNVAIVAVISSVAKADPTLPTTAHHPIPNVVGRERSTLGHISNPHLGYNRVAYPYGLLPNYSPPILQEDAGHIASPVHEKEPPQQPDEVHKDPQDYARRDVEFYPPLISCSCLPLFLSFLVFYSSIKIFSSFKLVFFLVLFLSTHITLLMPLILYM